MSCSTCTEAGPHECGKCKKKYCVDHLKVRAHNCVSISDIKQVYVDNTDLRNELNDLRIEISEKLGMVVDIITAIDADHKKNLESAENYRAAYYSGLQIVQDKIDRRDIMITDKFNETVARIEDKHNTLIDMVNEELKNNNIEMSRNTQTIHNTTNSLIELIEKLKAKNIIGKSTLTQVRPRK